MDKNLHVLTELEGRTEKYLAPGYDVSEIHAPWKLKASQVFSSPAWPTAQSIIKCFIIPLDMLVACRIFQPSQSSQSIEPYKQLTTWYNAIA